MTASCPAAAAASARFRPGVGGFTLLEVLVSLGIIIGALAGIAALLPAAGARLGEATETDRAGTMAANARADLANRRVVTTALWPGTTPAVVFGEGLPALMTSVPAPSSVALASLGQAPSFVLEDCTVGGGAPGICYGCMVSATNIPYLGGLKSGSAVRMTTVVFRKPDPDVKAFTLTQTGSGSTVFTSGSGAQVAADCRRFLAGCSWVLVSGSTASVPPRWFAVAASWTAYPPGAAGAVTTSATGASFVSLSGTECLQLLASGSTLQAYGFNGLLRVDERIVNLE